MIDKGQILPNGATVIDIDSKITPYGREYYVLADRGHEYVTWAVDPNRPASTCWGHYYDKDLETAQKGLWSRCNRSEGVA
tara:strand:+ start:447 stop:686 length:240 start_codon:yes stop_codon:yes gene_type:complete